MNNTKLKLVPLGSSDVITSSVPLSEFLELDWFGKGGSKNATVTGNFKGKDIYFHNSNYENSPFMTYLADLYGNDFESVSKYFSGTSFKYGTGEKEIFKLDSVLGYEYHGIDSADYSKYNGTYTFDPLSEMFKKQLTK